MPQVFANTEAFASMMRNGDPRERTMLGEMHLHYEAEIQRMQAEGHDPQSIAHSINSKIDESVAVTLKTKNGRKVQCSRGCAACCRIHVSITHEEAVLAVMAADETGVVIDWDRLQRQSAHGLGTWKEQTPADRRCVFLNSANECGIYEHRPTACRKYLVITEPKYCDTIKHPGHDVGVLVPAVGEAIVSAMLGVLKWGSMARMLLAVKP